MFRKILLASLGLAFIATTAEAQVGRNDRWVLLGTRLVNLVNETDTVDVTKAKGRFKAVRLVAKRSGILLSKVDVQYSNCAIHNEERRINLLVGERTRPIDLRSTERFIDNVRLRYKTAPGTLVPATVEVWGLQSPAGARAARAPSAPCADAPQQRAVSIQPTTPGGSTVPVTPTSSAPTTTKAGGVTAGGDMLFGVTYVGLSGDRDVIKVGTGIGKFQRIRLRVLDSDIHMNQLRVVYVNGEPDTLALDSAIPKNSRTGWLDLQGDRFIREIQLSYRAQPGSRNRARVEVYGEFAEGWFAPSSGKGGFAASNGGWLFVGAQSPLFFSVRKGLGYENDVVQVARNRGFGSLRVDVKDRAITLNRMTIQYADGTNQVVDAKTRVDAGRSFGPVNLRKKAVKQIDISYRSRLIDAKAKGKGYSFVEIWAR